ncbi:MAG: IS5 family transposase [Phycisphaerales bacterium]
MTDEEWALAAPNLTLMREDAPQREHSLRDIFDALRWMARSGSPWRYLPHEFPPWQAFYQQAQRWIAARCFEALVHDLRALMRLALGREAEPSALVIDRRRLQGTPESGHRGGYDGAKRRTGSKVHAAVDTLGLLLKLHLTAASEQDRAQVARLAKKVQEATGDSVKLAYVDQGYTGEETAEDAAERGIHLHVVRLPQARRGFVLLPRRWVVERSFAWAARFRRLAKDYERLPQTVAGFHYLVFACLMLRHVAEAMA